MIPGSSAILRVGSTASPVMPPISNPSDSEEKGRRIEDGDGGERLGFDASSKLRAAVEALL